MTETDWAQVDEARARGESYVKAWSGLDPDRRHKNPNTLNASHIARKKKSAA